MKNYILKLLILLFVLSFTKMIYCQQDVTIDYGRYINALNYLSKSAVYISTPQGGGSGTLFFVPFTDTLKGGAVYVATALHVLNKTDSKGKIIGRYDSVNVFMNLINGGKESRKYSPINIFADLDIAILQPIEHFRPFREYDVTTPSLDMIASFSELRNGQSTFLAGYPYGVGTDGKTLNPVTQSGIIAYVDTTHTIVLIDIPVNHGNSGCPVYVVTDKTETKLLGMVFEYEPSKQDYVFSKALNQMVPVNTSLGRVVLIRSIVSELNKLPR